jgi:exodeoxyribonuclease III
MKLKLASWNINSVRLRLDQVLRFVSEADIDVLCLQEIKCQADQFPSAEFASAGYGHIHIRGQKGWHGVAIVSRLPFEALETLGFCRRGEARVQAIRINGLDIWNFYIPAGGDVPDRAMNDKFDHKLEFYERLTTHISLRPKTEPLVICGDLNIAPGEHDVFNHKFMLKVVSHTPVELATFAEFITAGQLHDPFRNDYPEPQKLFSWWSYRAADFRQSNRGLRLDHILLNPSAKEMASQITSEIHDKVREWDRPSDHAPISVTLSL